MAGEHRGKSHGLSLWISLYIILSAGSLCSCNMANNLNVKPSEINSSEDSIVVGRVKVNPNIYGSCPMSPSFKLYNFTDNTWEWLRLYGEMSMEKRWAGSDEGYGKIILRKTTPGDYIFLVCVDRCVTLSKFTVPKGKMVYFGTVELDYYCGGKGISEYILYSRPGVEINSMYLRRLNIVNEYEKTMRLLRNQYPQVYEMYKNSIVILPQ